MYGAYGVKINATLVGGIKSISFPTGTDAKGEALSGQPFPGLMALMAQKPQMTFSTTQLARALAACGIAGFACSTGAFLTAYAQKRVNEGSRSVAADSKTLAIKKGLLVPDKLSWAQGGDAILSYKCAIIYDGNNNPIVFADAAVPSSLLDDERYGLLSCSVGGTTITKVQSVELDFGITLKTSGGDGEQWDTFVCIEKAEPKLTVQTEDLAVHSLGLYAAATQANTTVVFRKRVQGGKYAASTVTLAVAGMAHLDNPFDVSGTDHATASIVTDVNYDGTNDVVKFT